jgi:hypothetical protein
LGVALEGIIDVEKPVGNVMNLATLAITDARVFAEEVLREENKAALTIAAWRQEWRRLDAFLEKAHGVTRLEEVSEGHVKSYLMARTRRNRPPGHRLQLYRLDALRSLYRSLAVRDLHFIDPTRRIQLGGKKSRPVRPLTDAENETCRSAVLRDRGKWKPRVVWALAECGASSHEVALDTDLLDPAEEVLDWLLAHGKPGDVVYLDEAFDPWNEGLALRQAIAAGLAVNAVAYTGSALLIELI